MTTYANDFTLKELHELAYRLEKSLQCQGESDQMGLTEKLDDMIKNYCEHDFKETDIDGFVWTCTDCGFESI